MPLVFQKGCWAQPVALGLCKKSLRLVSPVLHGFRKGRPAQPRALFKEGYCAQGTFYTTLSKAEAALVK